MNRSKELSEALGEMAAVSDRCKATVDRKTLNEALDDMARAKAEFKRAIMDTWLGSGIRWLSLRPEIIAAMVMFGLMVVLIDVSLG